MKQKYLVNDLVLVRNYRMGCMPARNSIEQGFQIARVTGVTDSPLGHFVAVQILNETTVVETINPDYEKITVDRALYLLGLN